MSRTSPKSLPVLPTHQIRPKELATLRKLLGNSFHSRNWNSRPLKLLAGFLRMVPKLARIARVSPELADPPQSWRFGPRIEARLPGSPAIVLEALRVNGRQVRLELTVRHSQSPEDSSQVLDGVDDDLQRNVISIVRKKSQVVDTAGSVESVLGVDHVRHTVDTPGQPEPGAGSDRGREVGRGVESPDRVEAEKKAGAPGFRDSGSTEHRSPPCATHTNLESVENVVVEGVHESERDLPSTVKAPSFDRHDGKVPRDFPQEFHSGRKGGENCASTIPQVEGGQSGEKDLSTPESKKPNVPRGTGSRGPLPRLEETWRRIADSGDLADLENVECFSDACSTLGALPEDELKGIEFEVNKWVAGIGGGRAGRARAIDFLSGVVGRLRGRNEEIGDSEARAKVLDDYAWGLISDEIQVREGGAEVEVKRKSGNITEMKFSGIDSVRIVRGTDLRTDKVTEEVDGKQVGVRTMKFVDHVTGDVEERKFALIGKDAKILGENNKSELAWLSWEEEYAVKLIRVILDEVSR